MGLVGMDLCKKHRFATTLCSAKNMTHGPLLRLRFPLKPFLKAGTVCSRLSVCLCVFVSVCLCGAAAFWRWRQVGLPCVLCQEPAATASENRLLTTFWRRSRFCCSHRGLLSTWADLEEGCSLVTLYISHPDFLWESVHSWILAVGERVVIWEAFHTVGVKARERVRQQGPSTCFRRIGASSLEGPPPSFYLRIPWEYQKAVTRHRWGSPEYMDGLHITLQTTSIKDHSYSKQEWLRQWKTMYTYAVFSESPGNKDIKNYDPRVPNTKLSKF